MVVTVSLLGSCSQGTERCEVYHRLTVHGVRDALAHVARVLLRDHDFHLREPEEIERAATTCRAVHPTGRPIILAGERTPLGVVALERESHLARAGGHVLPHELDQLGRHVLVLTRSAGIHGELRLSHEALLGGDQARARRVVLLEGRKRHRQLEGRRCAGRPSEGHGEHVAFVAGRVRGAV